MGIGKSETGGRAKTAAANEWPRHEIEADVLEIWIGVSRLMARLSEPARAPARRKERRRRMLVSAHKPAALKPPASRSARAIP